MVGGLIAMSFEIYFRITGLYPEERDYINRRLELIRDTLYPNLSIDFSILKRSPNWICAECCCDTCESALKLYELLNAVNVPNIPTEYNDYIPLSERDTPKIFVRLSNQSVCNNFNTTKGMDI